MNISNTIELFVNMELVLVTLVLSLNYIPFAQSFSNRIVGGEDAKIFYPYMVSISDDRRKHICGGAIISKVWVVSAANCYTNRKSKKGSVLAGVINLKNYQYKQVREIVDIISHDGFNGADNDIALIKVASKFKFNEDVQPIRLPSKDRQVKEGALITVLGWGAVGPILKPYPELQQLQLTKISNLDCQEKLHNYTGTIIDKQICAVPTSAEEGNNLCLGDSGGPALEKNVLIGIVPSGYVSCVDEGNRMLPFIFTDVAKFADFIATHINKN